MSRVATLEDVYFSGDRKEFDRFLYYIKDGLLDLQASIGSTKTQINWVARHFRYPDGQNSMAASPLSYRWWIGLLEKNARFNNLPTSHTVSSGDDYKIPELASLDAFLEHLQETFGCQGARDDSRKALYALKQDDQDIKQFNLLFNTLVYAVDLTENERCDIYEAGLNVGLLTTAIRHTGWREAKTLDDKQALARSAAYIQQKLAQIDRETQDSQAQDDEQPNVLFNANHQLLPSNP
jgi:hypothetical protein